MHNSFINVNEEKMSKSLGNFKTIGDLLKEYSPGYFAFAHFAAPLQKSD